MKKTIVFTLVFALFGAFQLVAQSGWDAHLAKLSSTNLFTFTAMYGHNGVQWTSATSGQPTKAETDYLFSGFANQSTLFAKGPTLSGTKYMTTRAESNLIIGKKGALGFVAIKTAKTYVLVTFNEATISPNNANVKVQAFGDYLESFGY